MPRATLWQGGIKTKGGTKSAHGVSVTTSAHPGRVDVVLHTRAGDFEKVVVARAGNGRAVSFTLTEPPPPPPPPTSDGRDDDPDLDSDHEHPDAHLDLDAASDLDPDLDSDVDPDVDPDADVPRRPRPHAQGRRGAFTIG